MLFLSILETRYATYVECDVKRAFSYIVRTCVYSLPNTAGIPSLGAEPLACAGRAIYLAVMHESCPKKGKIFSATYIKSESAFGKSLREPCVGSSQQQQQQQQPTLLMRQNARSAARRRRLTLRS